LTTTNGGATWKLLVALRWEAIGPDGEPFPALHANVMLAPVSQGANC
jgi:hypothetical protein